MSVGIPDNNAQGICVDLVSDLSGTIAQVQSVEVAASHTWVGDLIFSLVSPDGTTVVLMDRPSPGSSADLASAAPITFDPGAAVSAEAMATGLTASQAVCQANGICEFYPNPGMLSAFGGVAASGTWRFCARDAGGGDTGTITSVTVTATTN